MNKFVCFMLALTTFFIACAHLSTQDRSDLAEYKAEQSACIVAHPGNQSLINECRDSVKKDWESKWNTRFDGGFGDGDGGVD